ncbi:MAG TPA: hypothetical protein VEG38_02890, partial [Acidimicrobiia bacterium]|nr:hypothetical protein [Acidimicrobiia bacterium]
FNGTVFKSNVADADDGVALGGGLFLAGDDAEPAETVLNDATVTKNAAKGDAFEAGGGIFVLGGPDDVDVNDSVITKNKPEDCATFDGEFFCGDL